MCDWNIKVVFFIGALVGHGAERVTCELANYLDGLAIRVEILTMSNEEPAYELNPTIKVKSLLSIEEKTFFLSNNIKRFYRLRKYLKYSDADCFIAMLSVPMILLLTMKKFIRGKVICAERSNPAIHPKWQKLLLKSLLKKADGFVAQTPNALEYYKKFFTHTRQIIIPNAVSQKFFDMKWEPVRREIVAVGRLSEVKNHRLLLYAFSMLADDFPECQVVIYGDGILRDELLQTAEKLGIKDRLKLPGWKENIGEEIRQSSLYVLTSVSEGMPNSLIEAMAVGLPVIATDCPSGGPASLISDGVNGFLIPVDGDQELADKIKIILQNPELAYGIGNAARESVTTLSQEKIYSEWLRFILTVISSGEANLKDDRGSK